MSLSCRTLVTQWDGAICIGFATLAACVLAFLYLMRPHLASNGAACRAHQAQPNAQLPIDSDSLTSTAHIDSVADIYSNDSASAHNCDIASIKSEITVDPLSGCAQLSSFKGVSAALRLRCLSANAIDGIFSQLPIIERQRHARLERMLCSQVLSLEGDRHAKMRKWMGAAFSQRMCRQYRPIIDSCARKAVATIRQKEASDAMFDLVPIADSFSLEIVLRILGIDPLHGEVMLRCAQSVEALFGAEDAHDLAARCARATPFVEACARRIEERMSILDSTAIAESRKSNDAGSADAVLGTPTGRARGTGSATLLNSKDANDKDARGVCSSEVDKVLDRFGSLVAGGEMTTEEAVANAIFLVMAGHSTTASLITLGVRDLIVSGEWTHASSTDIHSQHAPSIPTSGRSMRCDGDASFQSTQNTSTCPTGDAGVVCSNCASEDADVFSQFSDDITGADVSLENTISEDDVAVGSRLAHALLSRIAPVRTLYRTAACPNSFLLTNVDRSGSEGGDVATNATTIVLDLASAQNELHGRQNNDEDDDGASESTAAPLIAFGAGRHQCLGKSLGTMEAAILLGVLVKEFPSLHTVTHDIIGASASGFHCDEQRGTIGELKELWLRTG